MNGYEFCEEFQRQDYIFHNIICENASSECFVCHEMEHHSIVHELRFCSECNEAVENSFYEEHKENWCPIFREICLYCETELPTRCLSQHRENCDMREEFHRTHHILDYLEAQSARNHSGDANPGASANNPSVEVIDLDDIEDDDDVIFVGEQEMEIIDQGDIEDDDDAIFVGEQKMEIGEQEMEIIDLVSDSEDDVEVDSSLDTE